MGGGSTDPSLEELAVGQLRLAPTPRNCLMHIIDLVAPSQTRPQDGGGPALARSQQSWGAALLMWPSAQISDAHGGED